LLVDDPRLDDIEGPQPRGLGLRDIDVFSSGESPTPFGVIIGNATSVLNEPSAVAVIHRATIHLAGANLAKIAEVKATLRVEDEIVRTLQGHFPAAR
jgi:hypothetical protein